MKINISSVIFHLDEDAFQVLNAYIEKIKTHFSAEKEGGEIVSDIEARIAELLQYKITTDKQVITLDDINEVIEILGKPEDFMDNTDYADENTNEKPQGTRRFYRDLDHNYMGGVCAGLGAHFNIDPIIMRVLFIILAFPLAGFTILLYLALWIVIPAAITTQQKAAMHGANYRISDIEQAVKNEFEHVKGNFKNYRNSESYRRTQRSMHHARSGFVEILNFIGRIFIIVFGVTFIIIGISMIASFFGLFVFSDSLWFWVNPGTHHPLIPDFMLSLVNPQSIALAVISLIIFIAAPIIALIYWGLKLILRFKANDKIFSVVGAVAWILSLLILIGITLFEVKSYAFSNKFEESVALNLPRDQVLYVKANYDIYNFSEAYFFDEGLNVYTTDEHPNRVYFPPDINIKYTNDSEIYIAFEKEARGATNVEAKSNAKQIDYHWYLQDSVLFIDPLFYQNHTDNWTFPEMDITIYLPEDQQICIDNNLDQTLNYVSTASDIWLSEIPGKCWIMTDDGLDHVYD